MPLVNILFIIVTLGACLVFYLASGRKKSFLYVTAGWLALQAAVALTGFYTKTDGLPPRFVLLIVPPVVLILILFSTEKGKAYIDSLNAKYLVLLHVVRIPVEIVLFMLFMHKAVPEIMTFEGNNFDILSGITAIIVYYFGYVKNRLSRTVLLCWNIICMGLLVNIVTLAVLSAPFPFQQLAFEQPNIGVLYFPFIWLPCCVVPLVLFCHLASLRLLLKKK